MRKQMVEKEVEKAIEDFVIKNTPGGYTKDMWEMQLILMKEHQDTCEKEHCHKCWRGDYKKW